MNSLAAMKGLQTAWKACVLCNLHERRGRSKNRKLVFGVGNINADLMFIGMAPGAQEELEGIPFVGPSGKILDAFFQEYSIEREDVFISNLVACRPCAETSKGNKLFEADRDPVRAEIDTCRRRLLEQIYIVDPLVIVTLGAVALKAMAGPSYKLKDWVGDVFTLKIPGKGVLPSGESRMLSYACVSTYHPSYLLRTGALSNHSADSVASQFNDHLEKALNLVKEYRGLVGGE